MTAKEFNKGVDDYADSIFRFVLRHTKNRMLADDIVQDTFAKTWVKHPEIQAEKIKSYLFTCAYHCIIDTLKKENRSTFLADTNKAQDSLPHLFDVQKVLHEALDKLPTIQKSLVLLRDYEGYSYQEISEITTLSESQVKVYIFRARQSLKAYLKNTELVA